MANPLADIVIDNGESTPVSKTFNPVQVDPTLIVYANVTDADSISSRETVALGNRPVRKNGDIYKATLLVKIPAVQHSTEFKAEGGDHSVIRTTTCKVEFLIPDTSLPSEVDDLFAYVKNMFAESQFSEMVKVGVLPY